MIFGSCYEFSRKGFYNIFAHKIN